MQPLKGITVVTLEHAIAAPFCTRQLADLGRPEVGPIAAALAETVHPVRVFFRDDDGGWDDGALHRLLLRRQQRLPVEEARVLLQFLQGFGHHAAQKHARVHLPVEALANGPAAGRQVQGRAHGTDRANQFMGCAFQLTGPAQQQLDGVFGLGLGGPDRRGDRGDRGRQG